MALTPEGAALTELHRVLQVRLSSQSMAASRLLWSSMDPTKGAAAQEAWLRQQVALSGVFDGKSANLAADYVKKFRAAEGFPGGPIEGVKGYDPDWARETLSYNGTGKVNALMDSGVAAKEALARAAPNLLAASQRVSLDGGRRVVDQSALANPDSNGWRRVPDGNPCSFCAMLVSRGNAYRSERSAGLGRHWHKRCGCSVEEVFGDWTPTEREQQYLDTYNKAREDLHAEDRVPTTTNILEKMRLNGKFNDSPTLVSTKAAPSLSDPWKGKVPNADSPLLPPASTKEEHVKWENDFIKGGKATPEQRAARQAYMWQYWREINGSLQGTHTVDTDKFLKLSNEMEGLMKSAGTKTTGPTTVFRSIDANAGYGNWAKGDIFEEKGWTSTSFNDKGKNFGDIELRIDVPPGKEFLYGESKLANEMIFPPGTKFKVVSRTGNKIHLVMDHPDAMKLSSPKVDLLPPEPRLAEAEAKKAAEAAAKKAAAEKAAAEEAKALKRSEAAKKAAVTRAANKKKSLNEVKAAASASPIPKEPPVLRFESGREGATWASNHWSGPSAYSEAQVNAIRRYTGPEYTQINKKLRVSEGKKGAVPALDSAIESAARVPQDVIVRRGATPLQFGLDKNSDLSSLTGKTFTEHGYLSTTVDPKAYSKNRTVQMNVKVPKGQKALYVSGKYQEPVNAFDPNPKPRAPAEPILSVTGSEYELILPRGSKYRVTGVKKIDSQWHVDVEIIGES